MKNGVDEAKVISMRRISKVDNRCLHLDVCSPSCTKGGSMLDRVKEAMHNLLMSFCTFCLNSQGVL